MSSNDDLLFQRYSHDKLLGGTSPSVDSGPTKKKHTPLSPGAYHAWTGDKTIEFELEKALEALKELLMED